MSRQRRSLKDRDEFAIAAPTQQSTDEQPDQDGSTKTPQAGEAGEAAPAPQLASRRSGRTTSRPTSTSVRVASTSRIGIYFRHGQFEAAKAAYLADWQGGGEADTFGGWVAHAIERAAGTDTTTRAGGMQLLEGYGTQRGLTRSFNLPDTTIERLREAQRIDQARNVWTSQSEFCAAAVAAAIAAAREHAGGQLPPPPSRLPNRLTR